MLTRQAFLLRSTLAVGAAFGTGAVQPFVSQALAQGRGSEPEILEFLLTLEYLESEAYQAALRRIPSLTPEVRDILEVLAVNERRHVEVLREAIRDLGARPSESPRFGFDDALTDQEAFLELAQRLEDVGVYAYNGAIPNVRSEPLVALLAASVQVEGRHAAAIRQLRGFPIVESAFDVGVGMREAFRLVDHLILT